MCRDDAIGMSDHREALPTAAEDAGEGLGLDRIHYVKEAFQWQYNWIGLAGAAVFALLSGSGLPLVLAAGLELMYLSLAPQSSRFRRLVRSWKYAEQRRRQQEKLRVMFHELPPELRTRYAALDKMCKAIQANYRRLSSTSQIFVQQMEQKLQGLLYSYLRLAHAAGQHRDYIQMSNPESVQREMVALEKTLDSDSPKVREINRKRIEILAKRLEKFATLRENRQVIEAQCEAIEDVLALIRDQSITMTDPQQVSERLESLLLDVEQTEQAVQEVEAIFALAAPEQSLAPLPSVPAESRAPSPRTRARN